MLISFHFSAIAFLAATMLLIDMCIVWCLTTMSASLYIIEPPHYWYQFYLDEPIWTCFLMAIFVEGKCLLRKFRDAIMILSWKWKWAHRKHFFFVVDDDPNPKNFSSMHALFLNATRFVWLPKNLIQFNCVLLSWNLEEATLLILVEAE